MAHLGLRDRVSSWFRQTVGRAGRYGPILAAIGLSLGLTLGLFVLMRRWERQEQQAELGYASKHIVEALRRATERIQLTHEFMRQDYYGSSSVSREEFSLCAEPILAHVPSLKVLQWAPRVDRGQRDAFEQTAQREGWPNYRIIEPDRQGKLIPAPQRDVYFPIWYAASKSGFKARFGWDFAADPALQAAIDKCRDTGQFVTSDLIDLSNIGLYPRAVQTFIPVYRDFRSVHTLSDRRTHLKGLLVGLCQLDDLVNCALSYASGPQGIDLAVFDESLPADGRLLYFHPSRTRDTPDAAPTSLAELESAGIHHTDTLEFGGRRWSLVCTPAPYFFSARADWRSWAILAIGLLVTACSAAYTWSATTRTERIQRLVDERTAELRKKDDQLRQSQKLEAVGSLAGGIAHEFNNLLQAIGGYTRYAMEGLNPADQPHQDLQNVLQAADRATALTRQLLSFSRRQTVERKECGANQLVTDVTKMLRPLLGEQIQMKVVLAPDVGTIFADAGSFQQVLLNLCLNARDAMPSGGQITVKTERIDISAAFAELYTSLKPGGYVQLSVADTGQGMTAEVRERIFEPFFTTKPVGKGTGLGLSMVYGIVEQHEGAIHVYSEPNMGTTFKIYLPVVEPTGAAPIAAPASASIGGGETILVAEDDPMVRDVTQRVLAKAGYTVLPAADGEEALALFQARRHDISLVILDGVMPKLGGFDVYRRIKEDWPETRVIFCSGYDPETAHAKFPVDEHLRLVEKPYDPAKLLRVVREVLDAEKSCLTQ